MSIEDRLKEKLEHSRMQVYSETYQSSIEGKNTIERGIYLFNKGAYISNTDIEPGSILLFGKGGRLSLGGTVNFIGSKQEPIILTSFDNTWKGIILGSQTTMNYTVVSSAFKKKEMKMMSASISLRNNSTALIENCLIENCEGSLGGAIHCNNSEIDLINTQILNCRSSKGAGIYLKNSVAKINNSEISGNKATSDGGAIYANNSNIQILNSDIENNSGVLGGALYLSNSEFSILNSKIKSNLGSGPNHTEYVLKPISEWLRSINKISEDADSKVITII